MSPQKPLDQLAIDTIRALAMDAVQAANSGHPGTPMALAPLGWVLFTRLRRHDPSRPEWFDRDRFVLSAGHASMLQYALLHLTGYDLPLEEIRKFRQWGSLTPGHPEVHHTAGVEATTGPLGQGIATAVGMALAERHLAARFNVDGHRPVDHRTWVIASDGDLMEGLSAEAASLAGHLKLGKLVVFWDDNEITIDGRTDLTFTEDVLARFAAQGWHTDSVEDGNDLDAIEAAGRRALDDPRPSLIRVRTIIGWPSPGKRDTSAAHGAPLGADEVRRTKELMGWPLEPAFHVPAELSDVTAGVVARGRAEHDAWLRRVAEWTQAHPALAAELERVRAGRLPEGWDAALPVFPAGGAMATRKAGGEVLQALAGAVPELVGGSADLAGSNLTRVKDAADFTPGPDARVPRNIHYGIREHAMAAASNGLALHGGVVPFAATFFVFSDYMRPSLRLAALSGLPVRYVFTHDSIGVGEDGPTHQPIEHLASLRAMPGMTVLRPADANETREAWKAAVRRDGPAALVLTRQNLPVLDREVLGPAEGLHRGAYVLAEAEGGAPEVILIASGSEVALALDARARLASDGVRARVVSMPSFELFAEQDAAYRDSVLPPAVSRRVVIEAATRFGWERWAGPDAAYVTLERFGASAPAEVLAEQFGFTPAHVAEVARGLLK